ncbi:MAG TPA: hypothetical protein DF613_13510 [Lachnospiraceae bacterium]|nr:hypothetical protein [Lachnospiraceae bacterium]
MKKMLRCMYALLAVLILSAVFALPVRADYKVKPTSISAVGSKKVTVAKGEKFELEVRMNPRNAEDDYLTWSIIKGKSVVRFEDNDLRDDEVDMWAVKSGTAKVRCKIRNPKTKKNSSVTYTITVKNSSNTTKITAVSKKTQTHRVGEEFELKVRASSNVRDDDLKWKVESGKTVVKIDDDDPYDDEMEFVALKQGTARISCTIRGTSKKVTFKITVKKAANSTITRRGPEKRTVYLGQEFELEVYRKNVAESYLRWKIADSDILMFEDGYAEHDDEVELIAVGVGTTTVTCTNRLTGKSVKFTVTVNG